MRHSQRFSMDGTRSSRRGHPVEYQTPGNLQIPGKTKRRGLTSLEDAVYFASRSATRYWSVEIRRTETAQIAHPISPYGSLVIHQRHAENNVLTFWGASDTWAWSFYSLCRLNGILAHANIRLRYGQLRRHRGPSASAGIRIRIVAGSTAKCVFWRAEARSLQRYRIPDDTRLGNCFGSNDAIM